jgi:hypothetical protein
VGLPKYHPTRVSRGVGNWKKAAAVSCQRAGRPSEILGAVRTGSIDIYEALRKVQTAPALYRPILTRALATHKCLRVRVFAAWAIGLTGNAGDFALLTRRYQIENGNARLRTNLVWAIFRLAPDLVTSDQYRSFLNDPCYHVRLVAIRHVSLATEVHRKFHFRTEYEKLLDESETWPDLAGELVRAELLRNVRSFVFNRDDLQWLCWRSLEVSESAFTRAAILDAFAYMNLPESLTTLRRFFSQYRQRVLADPVLGYHFARAVATLCESRCADLLQTIYRFHRNPVVRCEVLQALASAGGPLHLKLLRQLSLREANPALQREIGRLMKLIKQDNAVAD